MPKWKYKVTLLQVVELELLFLKMVLLLFSGLLLLLYKKLNQLTGDCHRCSNGSVRDEEEQERNESWNKTVNDVEHS